MAQQLPKETDWRTVRNIQFGAMTVFVIIFFIMWFRSQIVAAERNSAKPKKAKNRVSNAFTLYPARENRQ